MSKKFLLLTVAVIILVGGFFVWWQTRIVSHEFVGQVERVEGGIVYAEGVFIVPGKPELSEPSNKMKVKVSTNNKTEFIRNALFMLSTEELKKSGGKWDPAQLKKEVQSGVIEDLKKTMSISVKSNSNILKKTDFLADKIEYLKQIYP